MMPFLYAIIYSHNSPFMNQYTSIYTLFFTMILASCAYIPNPYTIQLPKLNQVMLYPIRVVAFLCGVVLGPQNRNGHIKNCPSKNCRSQPFARGVVQETVQWTRTSRTRACNRFRIIARARDHPQRSLQYRMY